MDISSQFQGILDDDDEDALMNLWYELSENEYEMSADIFQWFRTQSIRQGKLNLLNFLLTLSEPTLGEYMLCVQGGDSDTLDVLLRHNRHIDINVLEMMMPNMTIEQRRVFREHGADGRYLEEKRDVDGFFLDISQVPSLYMHSDVRNTDEEQGGPTTGHGAAQAGATKEEEEINNVPLLF